MICTYSAVAAVAGGTDSIWYGTLHLILQWRRRLTFELSGSSLSRRRGLPGLGLPRLPGGAPVCSFPGIGTPCFHLGRRLLRGSTLAFTPCFSRRLPCLLVPLRLLCPNLCISRGRRYRRYRRPAPYFLLRRHVQQAGLRLPPGVGLGGQDLDARLALQLGDLLLHARGRVALVPQPLVPRGGHAHLAVGRRAGVVHEASIRRCLGRVTARLAEFVVGVSLRVLACCGGGGV